MPKPKNPSPVPPGSKHIRVELTPEMQERLRVVSFHARMSMAAFSRAAIVQVIEEAERRKGR